ncbi:hypothetical protein CROQUDRAFT_366773 [Cronartium quercuum f. sp. fusiforme G11]|uniref:Uncharacterized protein n=1 Tax=Cronartium quercuum f. sp. fusiforme G11 TaxID=708437 RepID=A0A9P6N9T6_9BASI|nr:hypothetical protein CROQUDRAFT_366773 [Cronartium quercuum f. sp. fusiforme G11]
MPIKRTIYTSKKKRSRPSVFTIPLIPPEEATTLLHNLSFGRQPGPSQQAAPEEGRDSQPEEADEDVFFDEDKFQLTFTTPSLDPATESLFQGLRAQDLLGAPAPHSKLDNTRLLPS